jgi:hypothetical protein
LQWKPLMLPREKTALLYCPRLAGGIAPLCD